MINLSFLEKIKHFIEIIVNNNYSTLIISILVILSLLTLLSLKMKKRNIKILYSIIYIFVIGILIYIFHNELLTLIDYLIENIVANLLFPNLAIYMGVLLIINIIVLITLFSNNVKTYVKTINIICFAITQLFLYFIIDNVIVNNVNVYEKLSIYTNENLLVLVELSMQFFVIWISLLGMIKLIDYLMEKSSNKVNQKDNLVIDIDCNNVDNYEFIEYVPIKKVKKI